MRRQPWRDRLGNVAGAALGAAISRRRQPVQSAASGAVRACSAKCQAAGPSRPAAAALNIWATRPRALVPSDVKAGGHGGPAALMPGSGCQAWGRVHPRRRKVFARLVPRRDHVARLVRLPTFGHRADGRPAARCRLAPGWPCDRRPGRRRSPCGPLRRPRGRCRAALFTATTVAFRSPLGEPVVQPVADRTMAPAMRRSSFVAVFPFREAEHTPYRRGRDGRSGRRRAPASAGACRLGSERPAAGRQGRLFARPVRAARR